MHIIRKLFCLVLNTVGTLSVILAALLFHRMVESHEPWAHGVQLKKVFKGFISGLPQKMHSYNSLMPR